jgi:DNA-binding GntR family transcriptional regulator
MMPAAHPGGSAAGMRREPVDQGRGSLTEDVYERVRASILAGRYLPGQKLKINELCDELQGSLGAVREALSRLRSEDLVEAQPYKGFSVAPVSPLDLVNLTRARIEVEKLCLASSLVNGDIEWEGRMVALLHQLSRCSPSEAVDQWSLLHAAFHDELVSACDNTWLLRIHRALHEQSERYRRLSLKLSVDAGASVRRTHRDVSAEHRRLVEAAIARDVERTCGLIAAHLQRTTDDLLTKLQAPTVEGGGQRRRVGRNGSG